MSWILTVYEDGTPGNPPHGHIEVANPAAAALAINEINDERGYPAEYKLDEVEDGWQCDECD